MLPRAAAETSAVRVTGLARFLGRDARNHLVRPHAIRCCGHVRHMNGLARYVPWASVCVYYRQPASLQTAAAPQHPMSQSCLHILAALQLATSEHRDLRRRTVDIIRTLRAHLECENVRAMLLCCRSLTELCGWMSPIVVLSLSLLPSPTQQLQRESATQGLDKPFRSGDDAPPAPIPLFYFGFGVGFGRGVGCWEGTAAQVDGTSAPRRTSGMCLAAGPNVQRLCGAIELVLRHGLASSWRNGYSSSPAFFPVAQRISRKDVTNDIKALTHCTTDHSRARAWIRLAVNEQSLESYISVGVVALVCLQI